MKHALQDAPATVSKQAGRLLHVDPRRGTIADTRIDSLPDLLRPGDLLVVNDAATLPASLPGIARGEPEVLGLFASAFLERHESASVRAQVQHGHAHRLHPEVAVRVAKEEALERARVVVRSGGVRDAVLADDARRRGLRGLRVTTSLWGDSQDRKRERSGAGSHNAGGRVMVRHQSGHG